APKAALAALAALRGGGAFEPIEAELLRPDGSRVHVMVGGALLDDDVDEAVPGASAKRSGDADGHARAHVGCFVLDTSQIKHAESLLRDHRDELEAEVRQRTLELSRAHIDLRRSHDLLSTVVEGIDDAIFVKDRAGRYVMVNTAAARVMNRPPEE